MYIRACATYYCGCTDHGVSKFDVRKHQWKINRTAKLIKLIASEKGKGSYYLSEAQVVSILELRLQKLTAFGINEI